MTDNEIITALINCPNHTYCSNCPSKHDCGGLEILTESAICMYNRQRTDIASLRTEIANNENFKGLTIEVDGAEGYFPIEFIKEAISGYTRQKAEIEFLRGLNNFVSGAEQVRQIRCEIAKAEAVKEFAERLCEDRVPNDPVVIAVKTELKMMKVGED